MVLPEHIPLPGELKNFLLRFETVQNNCDGLVHDNVAAQREIGSPYLIVRGETEKIHEIQVTWSPAIVLQLSQFCALLGLFFNEV